MAMLFDKTKGYVERGATRWLPGFVSGRVQLVFARSTIEEATPSSELRW